MVLGLTEKPTTMTGVGGQHSQLGGGCSKIGTRKTEQTGGRLVNNWAGLPEWVPDPPRPQTAEEKEYEERMAKRGLKDGPIERGMDSQGRYYVRKWEPASKQFMYLDMRYQAIDKNTMLVPGKTGRWVVEADYFRDRRVPGTRDDQVWWYDGIINPSSGGGVDQYKGGPDSIYWRYKYPGNTTGPKVYWNPWTRRWVLHKPRQPNPDERESINRAKKNKNDLKACKKEVKQLMEVSKGDKEKLDKLKEIKKEEERLRKMTKDRHFQIVELTEEVGALKNKLKKCAAKKPSGIPISSKGKGKISAPHAVEKDEKPAPAPRGRGSLIPRPQTRYRNPFAPTRIEKETAPPPPARTTTRIPRGSKATITSTRRAPGPVLDSGGMFGPTDIFG